MAVHSINGTNGLSSEAISALEKFPNSEEDIRFIQKLVRDRNIFAAYKSGDDDTVRLLLKDSEDYTIGNLSNKILTDCIESDFSEEELQKIHSFIRVLLECHPDYFLTRNSYPDLLLCQETGIIIGLAGCKKAIDDLFGDTSIKEEACGRTALGVAWGLGKTNNNELFEYLKSVTEHFSVVSQYMDTSYHNGQNGI